MRETREPYWAQTQAPSEEERQKYLQSTPARAALRATKNEFLSAVRQHRVVVVVGDTGCGKSTQLPQAVMNEDTNHRIVVTQSRRIAARTLARRVAVEINDKVARRVAYQIRGQADVAETCQLIYCTTGVVGAGQRGSCTAAGTASVPRSLGWIALGWAGLGWLGLGWAKLQ